MSKKIRKYGDTGKFFKAEFSAVNNLGVREYQTRTFTDEKKTSAQNKKDAVKFLDECEKTFREKGTFANEDLTFAAFVETKKKTHFHEAVIKNGKKISGLKGWERCGKYELAPIIAHFGKAKLKNISSHDVEVYRLDRLNTPTQHDRDRSIASVNRELAMLRKIFNLAFGDKKITFKPVFQINLADENERTRILTADEERRLLAALEHRTEKQGKRHLIHLKPLIVTALNTACRAGELLKLTWKDVDFDAGVLRLPQTITKTESYRIVPIADAARIELEKLYAERKSDGETVFKLKYYSDGFRELLKVAKIYDCRFHDLRHTATTNFVRAGMRTETCMGITGHTTAKTFKRYVNLSDADYVEEFQKVEAYKIRRETPELATEAVN